jgi:hypothetical protein
VGAIVGGAVAAVVGATVAAVVGGAVAAVAGATVAAAVCLANAGVLAGVGVRTATVADELRATVTLCWSRFREATASQPPIARPTITTSTIAAVPGGRESKFMPPR